MTINHNDGDSDSSLFESYGNHETGMEDRTGDTTVDVDGCRSDISPSPATSTVLSSNSDQYSLEGKKRSSGMGILSVSEHDYLNESYIDGDDDDNIHNPQRKPDFQRGDHVYQWCSLLGVPGVFAHHGIVVDVTYRVDTQKWSLLIVDFDNWRDDDCVGGISNSSSASSSSRPKSTNRHIVQSLSSSKKNREVWDFDGDRGNLRVHWSDPYQWKKVEYGVGFWRQSLSRGGTVTKAESDPPDMVIARVQFLMEHPHLLPSYHVIQSNCECAATWCKTGRWMTLQAAQFLHGVVAGHIKSTATVAGAVATTQVTVPSAGLWGWLGYTTQVSLMSTQPWIVPALIVGGTVAVGAPAIWLAVANKHWKKMTQELNDAFYDAAGLRP